MMKMKKMFGIKCNEYTENFKTLKYAFSKKA